MGSAFAKSKWNGHNIVFENYSYHVVSDFFVAIYPISCSNEIFNHSWRKQQQKKPRKYTINIVIHLLAIQNDNFLKKNEFDW